MKPIAIFMIILCIIAGTIYLSLTTERVLANKITEFHKNGLIKKDQKWQK